MSGSNAIPLKPLPALGYYASEHAFAITNLSIISSDNEIDFLDQSVSEVDDSISPDDANYLAGNLSILDSEIDELEQASNAVATLGKKWIEDASKHPSDKHDAAAQQPERKQKAEQQKYDKMRLSRGTHELESHTFKKFEDLRRAIVESSVDSNKRATLRSSSKGTSGAHYADENFQDTFAESDEVRCSTDTGPDHSGQSNVGADANFQDSFTENKHAVTIKLCDFKWARMTRLAKEQKL